jgi:ring-1,2-phenylacetyl-CoA epoxidase subunit PaaE
MALNPEITHQDTAPSIPVMAKVTVILDDETHTFELSSDGKTIVDAAIAAGADAPWSCHAGVCATCKAKLLKGAVRMDNDHALSADEKAKGVILTCQSHPISEEVVVSYD